MQRGGVEDRGGRLRRHVVRVPEPPTARQRVGSIASVTRRAVVSEVGVAIASGVVGTITGTAGITTLALHQGWILRPEDRDKGRTVVWQQREEDIRKSLQDELPSLHESPEVLVGPYARLQDSSFMLGSVGRRKFGNKGGFFLSEPIPRTPSEFLYTHSRFINASGTNIIPQAVYEQVDGTKTEAYSNSNFELIVQGSKGAGSSIEFFDFNSLTGLYPGQPDSGYMAALVPLAGSKIPKSAGDRFVFLFQRQKSNKVWIPSLYMYAYEVEEKIYDPMTQKTSKGENYIFVGWQTDDPKRPNPFSGFQVPPYDSLAIVITDKNGQVVQSAQTDIPSWGTQGYLEGATVDTRKEVPVKRNR